jgi:hypothetical protein
MSHRVFMIFGAIACAGIFDPPSPLAAELISELRAKICADTSKEVVPDSTATWGCYDPLPGHPTALDKKSFLESISKTAIDAEWKFESPAPALVAMALVESGAGYTRMPICSNNLYGFKWVSEKSAGGRQAFQLQCQPSWDANNRYVRFGQALGLRLVRSCETRDHSGLPNAHGAVQARPRERNR